MEVPCAPVITKFLVHLGSRSYCTICWVTNDTDAPGSSRALAHSCFPSGNSTMTWLVISKVASSLGVGLMDGVSSCCMRGCFSCSFSLHGIGISVLVETGVMLLRTLSASACVTTFFSWIETIKTY